MTMLIVAAAVATTMAATFAVASASAGTVLCGYPETTCAPSDIQPAGTWLVTGHLTEKVTEDFVLKTSSNKLLECGVSSMNTQTTAEDGSPLTATTSSSVNPKYCDSYSSTANTCSSVSINSPKSTIEATGGGSGDVLIGSTSEPLTITYTCKPSWEEGGSSTCTYAATGAVDLHINGEIGTATVTAAPFSLKSHGVNSICLGSPKLSVNHTIQGNVWPSKATETVLCSEERAVQSPCAAGNILPSGSYLLGFGGEPSGAFNLTVGTGKWLSCETVFFSWKTTKQSGAPLPAETYDHLSPSNCVAMEDPSSPCTTATLSAPPSTIESTGLTSSAITVGSAGAPLSVNYTCASDVTNCTMAASGGVTLTDTGSGTLATVTMKRQPGSLGFCPAEATLTIKGSTGGHNGGYVNVV